VKVFSGTKHHNEILINARNGVFT